MSSEPLDLDDPEVASWVALAQGHHEQTFGWRRLVLSDEVAGFEVHTTVSIDVDVLRGRDVTYGRGDSTIGEIAECDQMRARQLELDIQLATADGAIVASFRRWFEPQMGPDGLALKDGGFHPDKDRDGEDFSGSLDQGLDPALGGTPSMWVRLAFYSDSVQGTLSPELNLRDDAYVPNRASWTPIEGFFPDRACPNYGDPIGLDEIFEGLAETPRATFERVAEFWESEPIPAVWSGRLVGLEPSGVEVPPPTEVTLRAGEPDHACVEGYGVTVIAPLTVTTADGRVNLTQSFAWELSERGGGINTWTPWIPAADLAAQMSLRGLDLGDSAYGQINFNNLVRWQDARLRGSLYVSKWEAFTYEFPQYPALEWCRGNGCIPIPEGPSN